MAGKAGVTKIRGPLKGPFGGKAWWAKAKVTAWVPGGHVVQVAHCSEGETKARAGGFA